MSSFRNWVAVKLRRRAVNLQESAGLQIRFPLLLILLNTAFLATIVLLAAWGYRDWYEGFVATEPPKVQEVLFGHTRDFLRLSGLALVGYVAATAGLSLAFSHKLLGPSVAIRRQVEAMKNGDYTTRVGLRDGDSLQELAAELNDLAAILESQKSGSAER